MLMTISKDLFLAILALDSYNRGYGSGLSDGGKNDKDGLGDANGTEIGNATVVGASSSRSNSPEVAAGFYAIAYDTEDYGTVISYRGTDFAPQGDFVTDIANGWAFGGGDFRAPQVELSAAFLEEVAKNGGAEVDQEFVSSIILTGHSPGGGLAGLGCGLSARIAA
jgi:hypothetical protein